MEIGHQMTNSGAIIIGATGGIGGALVEKLSSDGNFESVVGLSRHSVPAINILDESSIAAAANHVRHRRYRNSAQRRAWP
jgi:uncharacterized protein YbjT (DUF2867 family)